MQWRKYALLQCTHPTPLNLQASEVAERPEDRGPRLPTSQPRASPGVQGSPPLTAADLHADLAKGEWGVLTDSHRQQRKQHLLSGATRLEDAQAALSLAPPVRDPTPALPSPQRAARHEQQQPALPSIVSDQRLHERQQQQQPRAIQGIAHLWGVQPPLKQEQQQAATAHWEILSPTAMAAATGGSPVVSMPDFAPPPQPVRRDSYGASIGRTNPVGTLPGSGGSLPGSSGSLPGSGGSAEGGLPPGVSFAATQMKALMDSTASHDAVSQASVNRHAWEAGSHHVAHWYTSQAGARCLYTCMSRAAAIC